MEPCVWRRASYRTNMSKTVIYEVEVMFGDCDPAGIVFFPNFSKWMDAASLNFFIQCGIPPWRELSKTTGIIGTPLLEIQTRFIRPATYGERLQVYTGIQEWRKSLRPPPSGQAGRHGALRGHRSAGLLYSTSRRPVAHQGHPRSTRHQDPMPLKRLISEFQPS